MRTPNISLDEVGHALGMKWDSPIVLKTADKLCQLAKNAKSDEHANTLINHYLKQKKRKSFSIGSDEDVQNV